jgi:hypothetical protein
MKEASSSTDTAVTSFVGNNAIVDSIEAPYFTYDIQCVGEDGQEKWRENFRNLVTNVGRTFLLNVVFGSTAKPAGGWFLGMISTLGANPNATDTLASKGWTESTAYTGNRKAITFGTASAGSITHTAVSFGITATDTINGCFVCDAASGTSGTLYSAGTFTARAVGNNDTLNITVTLTIS